MSRPSRRPSETKSPAAGNSNGERLQKVLAAAGVASRRECEQLILDGRVEVDGQSVTKLGTRVDAQSQKLRVDGVLIRPRKFLYFMLHKPAGVLSTNRDPEGRLRVVDLIDTDDRVYTVGRLDKSSEGLMLVTNDGDLANRLTHPRYGVEKTYFAHVVGTVQQSDLSSLRKGIHLADGFARVKNARIKRRQRNVTILEIVLDEGRNREVRRLLARIGHKVIRLIRVAVGPLKLGDLPNSAHRRLTSDEVNQLRKATDTKTVRRGKKQPTSRAVGTGSSKKRSQIKQKKKTKPWKSRR